MQDVLMRIHLQPVAAGPADEAHAVTKALIDAGNIVSVGYMLRYLRCVQKMKQIIHENNLTVMGTVARYVGVWRAGWGGGHS